MATRFWVFCVPGFFWGFYCGDKNIKGGLIYFGVGVW
jgi:hypothetical protein